MRRKGLMRTILGRVGLALGLFAVIGLAAELKTWRVQSELLSDYAKDLSYRAASGANPALRFPSHGPHDGRLGYSRMPEMLENLGRHGFTVESQAVMSPALARFVERGGFAPYREKTRAGLALLDRRGEPLFQARYPEQGYADFDAVPPLLVESLLFIENRELLEAGAAGRNPAIEWDRLAHAVAARLVAPLREGEEPGGGSTLATQLEKFRHSPGGRTSGVREKLRQIASASARAYLDGPDTRAARQRIVVDYLNSTPLGGRAPFGEVNGLAAGLRVWYGTDFETANRLLAAPAGDTLVLAAQAGVYKQALSLLLAQRRPRLYLVEDRSKLSELTERYLRLLARAGVIDARLRDAATAASLAFAETAPHRAAVSFVERKATNAVRADLMALLGEADPYALSRLDMSVATTLQADAQARVVETLREIRDPAKIARLGLAGRRLLGRGDPAKVDYSVTLYERAGDANVVRVQADTLERPFDLNEGAKLDLGSTAKLRTLITYLEAVHDLHRWYGDKERHELDAIARERPDQLTLWGLRHLANSRDRSLTRMLEAALLRRYSARPGERFFTGGGVHTFVNFNDRHDHGVFTVAEAFRHSINLPFVRLMRDIVAFHIAHGGGRGQALLAETDHPARQDYLARYADQDGIVFLDRFRKDYAGKDRDAILARAAERVKRTPKRLTVVFRSLRPEAAPEDLAAFLLERLAGRKPSESRLAKLYDDYAPGRFSLVDRAYLAGLHPLELWLAGYLQEHPDAKRAEINAASAAERQEVMAWLIESGRHKAQNLRIWSVLEQEAFARIHRGWQRLGYPFGGLVPSLATAIGSSADRPDALAELVGILLDEGRRRPSRMIERLDFAVDTPYETTLVPAERKAAQVLAPEIAAVVRQALVDVVENGTARRAKTAFARDDRERLTVGAKTGTGDNKFKTFGPGGRLIDERVVNRTATLVFFVGDRFFGTITAYVEGPQAADYGFTSSLPAQLLKVLAPAFEPLIEDGEQTAAATPDGG